MGAPPQQPIIGHHAPRKPPLSREKMAPVSPLPPLTRPLEGYFEQSRPAPAGEIDGGYSRLPPARGAL
eukprot:scaffold104645_cov29-Tisochrysis_lutea.AAC.1